MSMDMEEIAYHNIQAGVRLDLKTEAVTHIYDGEEVVSASTMDGADEVWIATFGCGKLAAQYVRILNMLGVVHVPLPDTRMYVGKRK